MADLFGNSTLQGWMSPGQYALAAQKAAPQSNAGRTILSLLGMAANMQAGSIPSDAEWAKAAATSSTGPNAAQTDAIMNGPQSAQSDPDRPTPVAPSTMPDFGGPNFSWEDQQSQGPRWMNNPMSPIDITASPEPLTNGGVFVDPNRRWDGSPNPTWMDGEPQSFKARSFSDFNQKLFAAKDINEVDRIAAENSQFWNREPVRESIKIAKTNLKAAENFKHQQKMEGLARQGRDIQVDVGSGIAQQHKNFTADINSTLANSTDEERAMIAAIQAVPMAKSAGGFPIPDSKAISDLNTVKVQQAARIAKASGLVPVGFESDGVTPKYGRPLASESNADWVPKTFFDESGKPVYNALINKNNGDIRAAEGLKDSVPPEVKAQQENNKLAIAAAHKELGVHTSKLEQKDVTPEEKLSAVNSANSARTRLKKLEDERVLLSTNWQGRAASPAALPSIDTPTDVAPVEPTATNPNTGEKLILRNGQWQPIQK